MNIKYIKRIAILEKQFAHVQLKAVLFKYIDYYYFTGK
jgi:hypothetical protein